MHKTEIIENKDQILIVGAGIAGLSLAIQLTLKNIPCVVLETRASFSGATSGVRISSKGVKLLENMGIYNLGEKTDTLRMYFSKSLITFDVQDDQDSSSAIIVTRLAVFEKLRERIDELGITVIYNFKLEQVIENLDNIVAIAHDGKQIQGKYLIGADGVGSKVRSLLNNDSQFEKRYAGYLGLGLIFPSEEKVEMSLFNSISGNVGLASIGKINTNDTEKNNFLWMHIHMSEAEAKAISDKEVYDLITERAKNWPPYLQEIFQTGVTQPKTILYHHPVYNGSMPNKWYSSRMFLIGDAAHPYGPGGQGISMAMLDAEALCNLFVLGITDEKKANFQKTRAAAARAKGESAEERNKPENQINTKMGLFFKALMMKMVYWWNRGKMEL